MGIIFLVIMAFVIILAINNNSVNKRSNRVGFRGTNHIHYNDNFIDNTGFQNFNNDINDNSDNSCDCGCENDSDGSCDCDNGGGDSCDCGGCDDCGGDSGGDSGSSD